MVRYVYWLQQDELCFLIQLVVYVFYWVIETIMLKIINGQYLLIPVVLLWGCLIYCSWMIYYLYPFGIVNLLRLKFSSPLLTSVHGDGKYSSFFQGKKSLHQYHSVINPIIYKRNLPLRYTDWCNNGTNFIGVTNQFLKLSLRPIL